MLITVDVICSFLPITLNHKAFAANQWWTIKIISKYYHNIKGDQKITGSLCLQTTSIYFYSLTNATYETGLKSSPSLIKMCCYLVGSLPFFTFLMKNQSMTHISITGLAMQMPSKQCHDYKQG